MPYPPKYFKETNWQQQAKVIRNFPLCTMLLHSDGEPQLAHVPMVLSSDEKHLLGHLAAVNKLIPYLNNSRATALFHGPDSYISPSLYSGERNVPTWNMIKVEVQGSITLVKDKEEAIKLLQQQNSHFEQRNNTQWQLPNDHPYTLELIDHIQAFKLSIDAVDGLFKLSQNKKGDRENVMKHMRKENGNAGGMLD